MKRTLLFAVICLLLASALTAVQTPEQFLGFPPGADRQLAHYDQIRAYFDLLARETDRVQVAVLGPTTLKREMFMAVISSAENLKSLDRWREIARRLSQAEATPEEAAELSAAGKAVVFIGCNQHATEIASSQMTLLLAHRLATADDPQVRRILDQVVLLLLPSVNPDGQAMEVEWYRKYLGTPWEGSGVPWLYHPYAGHDNNRDWFKGALAETRLVLHQLYRVWFPQVLLDEHQMGSDGDRFYVPPFQDPPTPGIHPLVWRAVNLFGARIAYDLEQRGLSGVASRGGFTGWWIGALDDTGWFHNMVGLLFEAASVRLASPVYIEPEEVQSDESRLNEERIFSPNPWKGGWWRLNDIVDYDLQATLSVLDLAAANRRQLLADVYRCGLDQIARGTNEAPRAWIVPSHQHDPLTARRLVQALLMSGVRVFRLREPLQAGGRHFEPGSFVVPMAQPYRAFVKNIFESQRYPDLRKSVKAEAEMPYDMAGWTLTAGMGVAAVALDQPPPTGLDPVTIEGLAPAALPALSGDCLVLDPRLNASYLAAFTLLQKGVPVYRAMEAQGDLAAGSFVMRRQEALAALQEISRSEPLQVTERDRVDWKALRRLRPLRVALYQNWGHNMGEGWLRLVFDQYRVPYVTVHPADLAKKDFLKPFDAVVFTGASESEIESGKPPKKWEKWYSPPPPEYAGGIGDKGEKALKEMLDAGGTLLFMDESCDYAINKLKLPLSNIMEEERSGVTCPGSYLRAEVKPSELTLGMPPTAAVFFRNHPTFATGLPRQADHDRRTPLVFPARDLLISGWLEGEDKLARRSLMVDFRRGKGRIILIGPDVIFRTQGEGTYKLMFNSLLSVATR